MYHTMIMTSGISLFSPSNFFGKLTRELDVLAFHRQNPILSEHETRADAEDSWLQLMKEHAKKSQAAPDSVSAEYSMVHALAKQNKLHKSLHIKLFHTNTLGGSAAAKLLQFLLEKDFSAQVSLVEIPDFDVNNRQKLNLSLGEFMKSLSDALLEGHKDFTCFAPIGGYKIMTSFGYLVGAFHGYPTAYLHEDMQMLHIIPPIPIDLDEEFLLQNEGLLRQLMIEGAVELSALAPLMAEQVKSHATLFTIEEGFVYLNPFGQFLFERVQYASMLRTKIYLSAKAEKTLQARPSQRSFCFQQIDVLLKKVKESFIQNKSELCHEMDFSPLKKLDLSYHLYKGASNGGLFRAAWQYDKKEDILCINYLWIDGHTKYEEEAARGVGLIEPEGTFIDYTEAIYDVMYGRKLMKI